MEYYAENADTSENHAEDAKLSMGKRSGLHIQAKAYAVYTTAAYMKKNMQTADHAVHYHVHSMH